MHAIPSAHLTSLLSCSAREISHLVRNRKTLYRKEEEPKPSGGVRIIRKPHPSLKVVQTRILRNVLERITLNPHIYGLSASKGVVANAKKHSLKRFGACFDVRAYFPSVRPEMVATIFRTQGFSDDDVMILTALTTTDRQLPQGAPTSNYIAALILSDADRRIVAKIRQWGCAYTRYFDDISVSGPIDLRSLSIAQIVEQEVRHLGFELNAGKTKYYTPGTLKTFTGVSIIGGAPFAPAIEKEIDQLLTDAELGRNDLKANARQQKRLLGLMGFLKQISVPRYKRARRRFGKLT